MENSPLNQAHLESRRAQRLKRSGRFQEALQCHLKAIDLLKKSMEICNINTVHASLDWQQRHHLRESLILEAKMAQPTSQKTQVVAKVAKTNNQGLITAIFKNLSQASEALNSYCSELAETGLDPRLREVQESHKVLDGLLSQLFPEQSNLDSLTESSRHCLDDSPLEESIHDNQPLPQLAPLEMPQFDFSLLPPLKD